MSHKTAKQIINQVAAEVGVPTVVSPYSSGDAAMIQMRAILDAVGEELVEAYDWQALRREESFTVDPADDNIYDLPDNFRRMIDQTGWQRSDDVPLFGPLSAQQWAYLVGRDLSSSTIYASFRLTQGKLYLFPEDPPDNVTIAYEYISDLWVEDGDVAGTYLNAPVKDNDIILLNSRLVERGLKFRFLQARGFDSAAAGQEYQNSLDKMCSQEKSAPILTAGDGGWQYPYLSTYGNTPDSGFGS